MHQVRSAGKIHNRTHVSYPSSVENTITPRYARCYSTSNHATLSGEPSVCHIEEASNNSQAIFEDTGRTTDSCSTAPAALSSGFHDKAPYIPLTSSIIEQHNTGNLRLNRNPTTQNHARQATVHRIECGATAITISLPPGLDAQFTLTHNGVTPTQRVEASANDQRLLNAAVENHIQEFCFKLDNDSLIYQKVEQGDAYLRQQLAPEGQATYPIGRLEIYVELLHRIGEITQGSTVWGDDLSGIGSHFIEDFKGKSRG